MGNGARYSGANDKGGCPMSTPYLSEIRVFPWNWAPKGWALCNGALLPIAQNTALFALLGTSFGGNGQTTFALPDLRSRVANHWGQGPGLSPYTIGQQGGVETVTLLASQLPVHTHLWTASSGDGTQNPPLNGYLGKVNRTGIGYLNAFAAPGGTTVVLGNVPTSAGGGLPHTNIQPVLAMNFCIATTGVFPSRN